MVLSMRRNADLRTLCFTALYFILTYFTWNTWETATPRAWWTLWGLTCFFSFVGAVAVHNTIHCPVFYNKLANKFLQVALSLTYGHPVSNYVPGHNLSHHQNMQKPKDVMRTSLLRFKWHLLNGIFFFPVIVGKMLGNDALYFEVQRQNRKPIYKQMKLEQLVCMTWFAALAIIDCRKFVLGIFLPNTFAKFCIITLNMLQHDGCDEDSEYNHSRNFSSPILNFFCYNNGYHSVHHMHPGWHWSILKDKHEALVKPHMHPNLDVPSILVYIFKTFIFPGIRLDYRGTKLELPPKAEDEAWFYATDETYSSIKDLDSSKEYGLTKKKGQVE